MSIGELPIGDGEPSGTYLDTLLEARGSRYARSWRRVIRRTGEIVEIESNGVILCSVPARIAPVSEREIADTDIHESDFTILISALSLATANTDHRIQQSDLVRRDAAAAPAGDEILTIAAPPQVMRVSGEVVGLRMIGRRA